MVEQNPPRCGNANNFFPSGTHGCASGIRTIVCDMQDVSVALPSCKVGSAMQMPLEPSMQIAVLRVHGDGYDRRSLIASFITFITFRFKGKCSRMHTHAHAHTCPLAHTHTCSSTMFINMFINCVYQLCLSTMLINMFISVMLKGKHSYMPTHAQAHTFCTSFNSNICQKAIDDCFFEGDLFVNYF